MHLDRHILAYLHTHTHTHTYIHIHAHTHSHTQVLKTEGIAALTIGLGPTLMRNCIWNSIFYGSMHQASWHTTHTHAHTTHTHSEQQLLVCL